MTDFSVLSSPIDEFCYSINRKQRFDTDTENVPIKYQKVIFQQLYLDTSSEH